MTEIREDVGEGSRRRQARRETMGTGKPMALFLSTFINKIDRKGRVSVPASWRATLTAQPFAGIICFPSFTDSCLEGMGMDRLEAYAESLNQYDAFSSEQSDAAQLIFASSRQLPWDTEGRVLLPEDFLAHSGIATEAAFVGCGPSFQIWEPSAHRDMIETARRRAKEIGLTLRMPSRLPPKGGEV